MPNAYVTVDPDGNLTLGSAVAVVDTDEITVAFNEVPHLATLGGRLFCARVRQALNDVGHDLVPYSMEHRPRGGQLWFDAEPWTKG